MAILKINNKDDFTVKVTLYSDYDQLVPIDPNSEDTGFEIKHYVDEYVSHIAYKSIDGTISQNCKIDGMDIYIYIDGFDFQELGSLYRRVYVSWKDENFTDGVRTVSTLPTKLNVSIV